MLEQTPPSFSARSQRVLFASTANQLPSRVNAAGLSHRWLRHALRSGPNTFFPDIFVLSNWEGGSS